MRELEKADKKLIEIDAIKKQKQSNHINMIAPHPHSTLAVSFVHTLHGLIIVSIDDKNEISPLKC